MKLSFEGANREFIENYFSLDIDLEPIVTSFDRDPFIHGAVDEVQGTAPDTAAKMGVSHLLYDRDQLKYSHYPPPDRRNCGEVWQGDPVRWPDVLLVPRTRGHFL